MKNFNLSARIELYPHRPAAWHMSTEPGRVSYNERQSGKHIEFTAAYLRVWRAEDGVCKLAAVRFQPEGER